MPEATKAAANLASQYTPYPVAEAASKEAGMSDGSRESVYSPGSKCSDVWNKIISRQMIPFTVFPRNQARDTISQVLAILKISMSELTEAFRAPDLLLEGVPRDLHSSESSVRAALERGVNEVFARQEAAEILGMQQADFAAVTGETFFPHSFAVLLDGLSTNGRSIISKCPWSTATLWGYENLATMQDREKGHGLSFIKHQLMPRAGIEFNDVLELVKTQCFGGELVIANETGYVDFGGNLENLRLLSRSSQSSPPVGELNEDICFRLQAFLRLKARVDWSIKDLDAAIYCLRTREIEVSGCPITANADRTSFLSISTFVLKSISSTFRLRQMVSIDPISLLPLWGRIDTHGPNSLMFQKFCTPALGFMSEVFRPPRGDNLLRVGGKYSLLSEEKTAVCYTLSWPAQYWEDLLEATGLKSDKVELELNSLSKLYRNVLLCKILGISPRDVSQFFVLFFKGAVETQQSNPLESPMETLAVVTKWKQLLDSGWTIKTLADTLAPSLSKDPKTDSETATQLVESICKVTHMTMEELRLIQTREPRTQAVLSIDFSTLTLEDLVRIHQYCDLRDSCRPGGRLIDLFTWISQQISSQAPTKRSTIAGKICSSTGWDEARLLGVLEQKYPCYNETDLIQALCHLDAFLALQKIMLLDQRIARATGDGSLPSMKILFDVAQPETALAATSNAESLKACLSTRQRDQVDATLSENRQRGLIT